MKIIIGVWTDHIAIKRRNEKVDPKQKWERSWRKRNKNELRRSKKGVK